jgi:hypothetical protein
MACFEGDEAILRDALLYRTRRENETVLSCCKQHGCADAEEVLDLNLRLFRHVAGYEERLQAKTKLRHGTWLALPVAGAEVRTRVSKYVGWSDDNAAAEMEQLWRLQSPEQQSKLTLTVTAPELYPALAEEGELVGWSTTRDAESRIGDKVMTKPAGQRAEVVAYLAAGTDATEEPALWKVRHDDDDLEDLEAHEWQALAEQPKIKVKRPEVKVKRQPAEATSSPRPKRQLTIPQIIAAETARQQKQYREQQSVR